MGRCQFGDSEERNVVEHEWGKAEAPGLQSGSGTGRNMMAERYEHGVPEEESWLWKHNAKMGLQWENGIMHETSEG